MIRFLDGPAAHVTHLNLRRAPVMLRVVVNAAGEWDALDQLDDVARPDETIHVYRMEGRPDVMFLDGVKGGRRCGWRETYAEYRYLPEQPADVRTNEAWVAWCEANKERLLAGRGSDA